MTLSSVRQPRFRRILCPIDFSRHSRAAIRWAAAMASRSEGRVTALFVNDPLLVEAADAVYHRRRAFLDKTRAELARFVRSAIPDGSAASASYVCETALGNPAREILSAAARLDCDLIVMGTHGLQGMKKLFFGSTTAHVLQRATIPVFAVPGAISRAKSTAAAPLAGWPIKRLIAPLDLGDECRRDVRQVADLARWFDADVLLVHVVSTVQTPPWLQANVAAHDRLRIAKARTAIEALRKVIGQDVQSKSRVVVGQPADDIATVAAKEASALVVMTLRADGGLLGARPGSIAYRVLSRATTPVLALPGRPRRAR